MKTHLPGTDPLQPCYSPGEPVGGTLPPHGGTPPSSNPEVAVDWSSVWYPTGPEASRSEMLTEILGEWYHSPGDAELMTRLFDAIVVPQDDPEYVSFQRRSTDLERKLHERIESFVQTATNWDSEAYDESAKPLNYRLESIGHDGVAAPVGIFYNCDADENLSPLFEADPEIPRLLSEWVDVQTQANRLIGKHTIELRDVMQHLNDGFRDNLNDALTIGSSSFLDANGLELLGQFVSAVEVSEVRRRAEASSEARAAEAGSGYFSGVPDSDSRSWPRRAHASPDCSVTATGGRMGGKLVNEPGGWEAGPPLEEAGLGARGAGGSRARPPFAGVLNVSLGLACFSSSIVLPPLFEGLADARR